MKNKFRSYSFWISVFGTVGLIINNLSKTFGFSFNDETYTQVVNSVCEVLILLGIITLTKEASKEENIDGDELNENGCETQELSKEKNKGAQNNNAIDSKKNDEN